MEERESRRDGGEGESRRDGGERVEGMEERE